jgi:hypothetical protein
VSIVHNYVYLISEQLMLLKLDEWTRRYSPSVFVSWLSEASYTVSSVSYSQHREDHKISRLCEFLEFIKTLRQHKIIRELQEVPWKSKDIYKQH